MSTSRHDEVNEPLVTIITVTFNLIKAGRTLAFARCVDSVKRQTYCNIEHLVIDGMSTDGTLAMIRAAGLMCISEPDNGIYDAFNKGLRKANGHYIAYLNSDDFYCATDAVELAVRALVSADADWCYAHAYWLTADRELYFWEGTLDAMPFGSLPCHQTVFAKRDVLASLNGFDPKYEAMADNLLMMRLCAEGFKSVRVDAPLVVFSGGGVSESFRKKCRTQSVESFYNLYGKKKGLTLDECADLHGGVCFERYSSGRLLELGLKLGSAAWTSTFFSMRHNIQRIQEISSKGRIKEIYLLGLPILKQKETGRSSSIYLFGFIRILKRKRSLRSNLYYYLFGVLPILKVKTRSV